MYSFALVPNQIIKFQSFLRNKCHDFSRIRRGLRFLWKRRTTMTPLPAVLLQAHNSEPTFHLLSQTDAKNRFVFVKHLQSTIKKLNANELNHIQYDVFVFPFLNPSIQQLHTMHSAHSVCFSYLYGFHSQTLLIQKIFYNNVVLNFLPL